MDNLQKPSSLPFQMDILEQALGITDGTGADGTNHGTSLTNQRFLQKCEKMTSYLHFYVRRFVKAYEQDMQDKKAFLSFTLSKYAMHNFISGRFTLQSI